MWNSKSCPEGIPIQTKGRTARKLTATSTRWDVGNLSGVNVEVSFEMAVSERGSALSNSIAIAKFAEN